MGGLHRWRRALVSIAAAAVVGATAEESPVDLVKPLAGTVTPRFDYFAAAARPFGMVALGPDTKHGGLWNAGYRWNDEHILSFSHIHNIQLAGIPVMPTVGECRGHLGMQANRATFDRATEIARPGYHKVDLTDRDVIVELTATCRVGFHRYTFPAVEEAHLVFDLGEPIGMTGTEHASAALVGAREVVGEVVMAPTYRRKVPCTVYFAARVDRPVTRFAGWIPGGDGERIPITPSDRRISGVRSGFALGFAGLQQGEQVQLKVALSYVGVGQARANLAAELPGWDFDAVVEDAGREWNEFLGRIRVRGGTLGQRQKFYTDLFRTGVGKRVWNDADGCYVDRAGDAPVVRRLPLDADGRPVFRLLDMDCLWGSQWNLNLLWLLAWPGVANDVARSFLEYHRHNGVMPRGVWGGRDSHVMVGDPATPLLAAITCQDKEEFDPAIAYAAARKNAFPGGVRDRSGYEAVPEPTGGGMPDYVRLGYVPVEVQQQTTGWHSGGTALTLEYAWQDWCVGHLARLAGKPEEAAGFRERAGNFRKVFDPESGWMRPRHAGGAWLEGFEPVASDDQQSPGFIEGNSAQYSFYVPQDVGGLISLMGGNESFIGRLDSSFRKAEAAGFRTAHGGHSRGWVEYGNQPSGAMAHLFSHAGAPWLTQQWVRRVHEAVFSRPTPGGAYAGDEDQGQLGALSALMAIGLFDVQGGAGVAPDWELTVPLFEQVEIEVVGGNTVTIEVERDSPQDVFIQSATWNGERVRGFAVPVAAWDQGGTLSIRAGSAPNKAWGIDR